MFYDAELSFFQDLLKNFNLTTTLLTPDITDFSVLDKGLHKLLGLKHTTQQIQTFFQKIKANTIYRVHDSFYCNYMFLLLPDTPSPVILLTGPYTTTEITKHSLMQLSEKYTIPTQLFSALEKYFFSLPQLTNETLLITAFHTLGERIWGKTAPFSSEILEINTLPNSISLSFSITHNPYETINTAIDIQAIKNRYALENQLLQAVSRGLRHKAEQLADNICFQKLEIRSADPLRNRQNYCIILNTLLRKAAELGSVHPFYVDRLSSDFGHKIEAATSPKVLQKLQRDMLHRYCLLVKNHSMKGYSPLIREVITKIDSDLTADLSLNTLSKLLNINASYLSRLFKEETGTTLTEYVNKKRVEHGIFLLNSTTLQIQTIALYCGVSDVNYFTKLFKKYYSKTPSEYRESIIKGGK